MARTLHHGRHFSRRAELRLATREQLLAVVPRWTPGRKAQLLAGIQNGVITMAQARAAHSLSVDELELWWAAWRRAGKAGLHTTVREGRHA